MGLSPALEAELVKLSAETSQRARVLITGTSMEPLLRAGMVVEIEALTTPAQIGDIIVFRSRNGLVAHRMVGGERMAQGSHANTILRTAGDANPQTTETVFAHVVVGRVRAVWTSAAEDALRVDDARFHRAGSRLARTRALRAFARKARAYARLTFGGIAIAPPPAFTTLVAATHRFEQRRYAEGVALLQRMAPGDMLETARRHHMSGVVSRWLDEAADAGIDVRPELREAFLRVRYTIALQAGRVLECVRHVRDCFDAEDIPHVLLKGAARLAADEPGADVHFSGDVDVLVRPQDADRAMAALRRRHFHELRSVRWQSDDPSWDHHHRVPVVLDGNDVPVEVHTSLAPRALVSQPFDFAALSMSLRRVTGPAGSVTVFDRVGTAVHLAYHARDLHVWRDIVLLARTLRTFDASARAAFDARLAAERRDRYRLFSAVSAADGLVSGENRLSGALHAYLAWARIREDLPPECLPAYLVEAVVGRCPMPELSLKSHRKPSAVATRWIRNIAILPGIARIALARSRDIA